MTPEHLLELLREARSCAEFHAKLDKDNGSPPRPLEGYYLRPWMFLPGTPPAVRDAYAARYRTVFASHRPSTWWRRVRAWWGGK